jgi:hypothetical protein
MVCERLIEAFRMMPYTGIHSPRKDVLVPVAGDINGSRIDLIGLTSRYIPRPGDHPNIRVHLLAWARAKAGVGPSISETCRTYSRGWNRDLVNQNRRRACRVIADGLNADGVPT